MTVRRPPGVTPISPPDPRVPIGHHPPPRHGMPGHPSAVAPGQDPSCPVVRAIQYAPGGFAVPGSSSPEVVVRTTVMREESIHLHRTDHVYCCCGKQDTGKSSRRIAVSTIDTARNELNTTDTLVHFPGWWLK